MLACTPEFGISWRDDHASEAGYWRYGSKARVSGEELVDVQPSLGQSRQSEELVRREKHSEPVDATTGGGA